MAVLDARQMYVSLDAIFDEVFTSPLSMPDLPFQGSIKLRSIKGLIKNKHHEYIIEHTGTPINEQDSFPNIKELKYPNLHQLAEDDSLSSNKRGEFLEEEYIYIYM